MDVLRKEVRESINNAKDRVAIAGIMHQTESSIFRMIQKNSSRLTEFRVLRYIKKTKNFGNYESLLEESPVNKN